MAGAPGLGPKATIYSGNFVPSALLDRSQVVDRRKYLVGKNKPMTQARRAAINKLNSRG